MEGKGCCGCHGGVAAGILVFLFGLTFLLRFLGVITDQMAHYAWPILIMLAGVKIMMKGCGGCCNKN